MVAVEQAPSYERVDCPSCGQLLAKRWPGGSLSIVAPGPFEVDRSQRITVRCPACEQKVRLRPRPGQTARNNRRGELGLPADVSRKGCRRVVCLEELMVVMMADEREAPTTPRYHVWQIKLYLRHYRTLDALSPRRPDGPKVHESRPFQWARFERTADVRGDLDRALVALGSLRPDRFYQRVLWAYYIQRHPASHIATILRTDVETIEEAKESGVDWICRYLNGEI